MRIAYSFGIIDFIHYGHVKALVTAKRESDKHIFGLVSDKTAIAWNGTMISDYEERKRVLEQIACVDDIMYQETFDPTDNLQEVHRQYPDAEIVLYHGNDWKIIPALEYVKSIRGRVVLTEYYEKLSPTNILKKLNSIEERERPKNNLISTKANTLLALKPLLKKSKVEEIEIITIRDYLNHENQVAEKIKQAFGGRRIVVRSSSVNEDCYETSNAGHFESILGVDSTSEEEIRNAVWKVISSYGYAEDTLELAGEEQILVQSQTNEVAKSGVVFTRDINENRPYYLINFDDQGSTDSVTGGTGGNTVWIMRNVETGSISKEWRGLLEAVREIEEILRGMVLDIEFAVKSTGEVVIFQVRPLAANYRFHKRFDDNGFFGQQGRAKLSYRSLKNIFGFEMAALSDMAFWNPAEMIGTSPHNLDYSLYREVITRKAWNEGIAQMGYKKLSKDLMCRIGNKPYIRLDYAFFSLIPETVSEKVTKKLVKYYSSKLTQDISAHDKIEFEIVFSCYDHSTRRQLRELTDKNFSEKEKTEIEKSLFDLTQNSIALYGEVLDADIRSIQELKKIVENVQEKIAFKENNVYVLLQYFKELILAVKRYGTPEFSRQARYAFIAARLCQTMVENAYCTQEEMAGFKNSIHTVASDFENDFKLYTSGKMSQKQFFDQYGHLRSGTYDIRSPRYDKIEFKTNQNTVKKSLNEPIKIKKTEKLNQEQLKQALADIGFHISVDEYENFLIKAPEMREYFKFEFTRALSLAIEILACIGENLEIDRRELSHLEMTDILASEYYDTPEELKMFWQTIIEQRRAEYKKNAQLILPEVILKESDIDEVHIRTARPNFITLGSIEGEVVVLGEEKKEELKGKIVAIEKADPGYDWIFTQGIAGLITQYGGAASHMAIRCAEFDLPAAIGCGEKIYQYAAGCSKIRLDCKKGEIVQI